MPAKTLADLVKDWGGFEKLVADLSQTGEVTVATPTLPGARRQIDVLIRHKQGLIEHLVVVECKYWNSFVERLHVDALATTVREVGASRGVIISTADFQPGAIEQARHEKVCQRRFRGRRITQL
jgi:predicted helicase